MKMYVTYGWNSNLRNNFSVVEGADQAECQAKICEGTHGKYAFSYYEDDFKGQEERYKLKEVPLQAQGERTGDYDD